MTEKTLPYDPGAPDVVLHEHCVRLRKKFFSRHEKALNEVNTLFHYTTAEGFQSILRGRSFWATNIAYLNDSSEIQYGVNLLRSQLNLLKDRWQDEFVSHFVDEVSGLLSAPSALIFRSYVVCLCSEGNLLSQWRGYGSSGGGYSIGLTPIRDADGRLANMEIDGSQGRFHLSQVIYDPIEQTALFDELLEGIAPVLAKHGPRLHWEAFREQVLQDAINRTHMVLTDLLPCFKSDRFSEEREYRYIYIPYGYPVAGQQFRIRNGHFVPYVTLNLLDPQSGPLRVSEVYCGPTLNAELTAHTVWQLAESLGHKNVQVIPSDIPLRF